MLACTVLAGVGCSDLAGPPSDGRLQSEYDQAGHLSKLTYDRDGDGRIDTWAFMAGALVQRVEVDENGDGRVDRWDYHHPGPPSDSAAGPDRTLDRIERATKYQGQVTRREFFEGGRLVRVEEDTDGNGRVDKWEIYEQGALSSMALDTTGSGQADRRLVYGADGSLVRFEKLASDGSAGTSPPVMPR